MLNIDSNFNRLFISPFPSHDGARLLTRAKTSVLFNSNFHYFYE